MLRVSLRRNYCSSCLAVELITRTEETLNEPERRRARGELANDALRNGIQWTIDRRSMQQYM